MPVIPNIYKVDLTHNDLANLPDTQARLRHIVLSSHARKKAELNESIFPLPEITVDEYKYYLFLDRVEDKESDWGSFLPAGLKNSINFEQSKINLLLFIETQNELLAIIGGSAYWIIARYIDHVYGLTTYDRIITVGEDEATSTKSRGITGARTAINEQYRNQFSIFNYLQFGKIPTELHIKLNAKTSSEYFSFLLTDDNNRLSIAAGSSFKILKSVEFDLLHQIVKELSTIMSLAPQEELSSYVYITDKVLLKSLFNELEEKIWNNIPVITRERPDKRDEFEFEFCNPTRIQEFYEAETYKLFGPRQDEERKRDKPFATVSDKEKIYRTVMEHAISLFPSDKSGLINFLYHVHVKCYVGTRITASNGFMYHFNAEFTYKGDSVFLVGGKWYKVKSSFVESLVEETESVFRLNALVPKVLDKSWDYNTITKTFAEEDKYNMLYDGISNYIVIDTIIVDGVELCDVLFIDEKEVYLIHIKHSFTARVRELTNQILISSARLQQARAKRDEAFFNTLYDKILEKGRSVSKLSKDEFRNIFFKKEPIYVFATSSHLTEDLPIATNIRKYKSNIARFSLVTCSRDMRATYYELKICQIPRTI